MILSIDYNTDVLQELTAQLQSQGFIATWTNYPETVSTLYNGKNIDLVMFGKSISQKMRLFIKKLFVVQNPAIIFVEGIAPIPSLLSEQIIYALMIAQGRNGNLLKNIEVRKK